MGSKARGYAGVCVLVGMLFYPAHGPAPASSPTRSADRPFPPAGAEVFPALPSEFVWRAGPLAASAGASAARPGGQVRSAAPAPVPAVRPPKAADGPAVTVVVEEGQTLWTLARTYRVSVDAIVAANGLATADRIRTGQRLQIPGARPPAPPARRPSAAKRPSSIVVRQGQTLSEIADRYGTSVRALVLANGLRSPHAIRAGQRLVLPGAGPASRAVAPRRSPAAPQTRIAGFLWPARGVLTSRFGWRYRRHHDGIDIAAPHGAPIYAARSGRVIFAGWYYGYGRAVILEHSGGLTTLYGHASQLLVRNGEAVQAGQLIARVGCTGRCSGSHLHFEIRLNGRAVDPLQYL